MWLKAEYFVEILLFGGERVKRVKGGARDKNSNFLSYVRSRGSNGSIFGRWRATKRARIASPCMQE